MIEAYVCPINKTDCPHYKFELGVGCYCTLENPLENCADFVGKAEDDKD